MSKIIEKLTTNASGSPKWWKKINEIIDVVNAMREPEENTWMGGQMPEQHPELGAEPIGKIEHVHGNEYIFTSNAIYDMQIKEKLKPLVEWEPIGSNIIFKLEKARKQVLKNFGIEI